MFQGARLDSAIGAVSILGWGIGLTSPIIIPLLIYALYLLVSSIARPIILFFAWRRNNATNERLFMPVALALAERELKDNVTDKQQWHHCLLKSKGNKEHAQALYIGNRARSLLSLIAAQSISENSAQLTSFPETAQSGEAG